MEKTNQRKRSGRKSSIEKIYLSGDELIEILEISKSLGNYPLSSVFTSNLSLEYIYQCLVNYRWKIELRKAKVDGRLVYTFNSTTKSHSLNKYYLLLELEEKFVLNLIEDLNR